MSYNTLLGATPVQSYDSSGINPAQGSSNIIAPTSGSGVISPSNPATFSPDEVPPAESVKPTGDGGEVIVNPNDGSDVIVNPEGNNGSDSGTGSSLSKYLPYLAIGVLLFLTMKGKKR